MANSFWSVCLFVHTFHLHPPVSKLPRTSDISLFIQIYLKMIVKQVLTAYINHSWQLIPNGTNRLSQVMTEKARAALTEESQGLLVPFCRSLVWPGIKSAISHSKTDALLCSILRHSFHIFVCLSVLFSLSVI